MDHVLPVVCTVKAIHAFMAKEEGDLTLNKGDIIKVHDSGGGWWKGTLLPDGIYGSFPSNFVELIDSGDDLSGPQGHSRQHSRQSSVDNSRFMKRKPVNTLLTATSASASTKPSRNSTTHLPYPGSNNASNVSLGATSRKNPQAIMGDSDLGSTLPGAFPGAFPSSVEHNPQPQKQHPVESKEIQNETTYNPECASEQQRRYSSSSVMLNPSKSTPLANLSPVHATRNDGTKHMPNRLSMPNLSGDTWTQEQPQLSKSGLVIPAMQPKDSALQRSNNTHGCRSINGGRHEDFETPFKHYPAYDHNYSEDPQSFQSGAMPRSHTEYSQHLSVGQHPFQTNTPASSQSLQPYGSAVGVPAFGYMNGNYNASQQRQPGSRHSIANFAPCTLDHVTQRHHHRQQHGFQTMDQPVLSLENLAKHNRSQGALEQPKSHGGYGEAQDRVFNQASLRTGEGPVFNPYDHKIQKQDHQPPQALSAAFNRMSMGSRIPSPSIVIPQPRSRPQSAFAAYNSLQVSPTESSPTSGGFLTPITADSKATATPTSAGTSMSEDSAFNARDNRRKSETVRLPSSMQLTASTFSARKFSVDAKGLLTSPAMGRTTGPLTAARDSFDESSISEELELLGTYTAKKPKTTLVRTFKQIVNPKKVAEKDAIRNRNEHFAWIEMQKSLKRVSSPEPGHDKPFFSTEVSLVGSHAHEQDPFEAIKRCQVTRDVRQGPGGVASSGILDFGPNTFVQVDKVARNVNQRGSHMTPQLLSQKYLTRPYSKSVLSKLRVLFIWVSENIRLEGGSTRDVSGGRFKLGPAGEYMTALAAMSNGHEFAVTEPSSLRAGAMAPPPAVFMTGVEEHAREFLQEDSPELAQEVLTSRMCKTGEGFANLFAEMALAAGIEDVGVVKGYVKGPMDVFSKEAPPPNHAWNVVRIDGTYRFIDCCLASPFHPTHYPSRPQVASSFYFLTLPTDLVLSHFPLSLTYQYVCPSIPAQIFMQLPFVRPAFFDFGLSLPDFRKLTRLETKDDEPVEVVIRIDGGSGSGSNNNGGLTTGVLGSAGSHGAATGGHLPGLFGKNCVGKGCGAGVELRAEVEVMTSDGKVIRKRALAQVLIWNPYQHTSSQAIQPQQQTGSQTAQVYNMGPGLSALSAINTQHGTTAASIAAASNRPFQSHHCTGIRIAKIKAVLPAETVVGAGGIRKGVLHIYAGRKVENAPNDAIPYSLALTLPIRHSGTMPKTPYSFVLPHFSPYEFYIKAPQAEMLYYPHTYKFSVLSVAAQAQVTMASASAIAVAEIEGTHASPVSPGASSSASGSVSASGTTSPLHMRNPTSALPVPPSHKPQHHTLRGMTVTSAQTLIQSNGSPTGAPTPVAASQELPNSPQSPFSPMTAGVDTVRWSLHNSKSYPYPHHHHQYHPNPSTSMAPTSSLNTTAGAGGIGGGSPSSAAVNGVIVPSPERLVLRTQTNKIYKLVYDPVRQCHEAQVEMKERGIWECVRMDDGGRSRVGREGTGGVVIASWKCV
ncbi:cytokinesis protein 3 [Mortierella claussenii]|nr:cytokinesis protein 3 [Mortierella claussenii]